MHFDRGGLTVGSRQVLELYRRFAAAKADSRGANGCDRLLWGGNGCVRGSRPAFQAALKFRTLDGAALVQHPFVNIAGHVADTIIADASLASTGWFTLAYSQNFFGAGPWIVIRDIVRNEILPVDIASSSVARIAERLWLELSPFASQCPFFGSAYALTLVGAKITSLIPCHEHRWSFSTIVGVLVTINTEMFGYRRADAAHLLSEPHAAVTLLANELVADLCRGWAIVTDDFHHVRWTGTLH